MSVRDAPHQLIADLHGDLLREISALTCVHWQGLGQAARALRKYNIIDGTQAKKLIMLDGAYNLSRHITVISSALRGIREGLLDPVFLHNLPGKGNTTASNASPRITTSSAFKNFM